MRPITRRTAVQQLSLGTAALIGAPAILRAQQLFAAYPFRLGIAAGDPSSDGFVIWTRLAPDPLARHGGMPMDRPIEVDWQVASDEGLKTVVARGTALARPELAHAVHVEVTGLRPDRPYWYRFNVGKDRSIAGRARTLPLAGAPVSQVRFGVAGCQAYEDGLFTAYRHLSEEDCAFVFHYGDYIYEGRGQPVGLTWDGKPKPFVRQHEGQRLFDIDDYRRRYAQYKMDPDLQAAHASCAWFTTFDDHEVENNWAGVTDQENDPPEIFLLRRAMAFQAYYEHMPLRAASLPKAGAIQLYRRAQIGTLMNLHLLDTRQFRTDQPCGDDFKPRCAAVDDPKASMMGSVEEEWLYGALRTAKPRWNAIAQQVMVMPLDRRTGDEPQKVLNLDSWAGYEQPRERLLSHLAGLGNAVVLTGDEHQNYAGELRRHDGQGEAVAVEFVSTSIASGGDGDDQKPGTAQILRENPFLHYNNNRRGYVTCEVTPDQWTTNFRTVDYISRPDAPVKTAARFAVERGKPMLQPA